MKICFSIILSITFLLCKSQSDFNPNSVNQFLNGKKHGYWEVYLDSNHNYTTKERAYYIKYDYYFNGKNKHKIRCDFKNDKLIKDEVIKYQDSLILLNGKFSWYDKKGRLRYEIEYKDGYKVGIIKDYIYEPFGESTLSKLFWDKKYNGQKGSFYMEIFLGKNGNYKLFRSEYYGEENGKWKSIDKQKY